MEFELRGHKCVKGKASGIALVCGEDVCFVGGIDINTGEFTEEGHPFYGENIKDRVLVYPTGKGSTGGAYCLYAAKMNNAGPAAIINRKAEQVTAVGAIIAEIPMLDEVETDPVTFIKTGDFVEVDADNGLIRIVRED